ncbi:hypothetical protein DHEL01_v211089 [Diaporthe helianthi]|uniref:Uncharacterized protein n=1 Tax=Diaporthe helianthi TaxID=158607 RepID=A0A2P5HJS5_DIAHE|nr:hypothetical protein DHEL01_v211089 [Diaporthe helianthi]
MTQGNSGADLRTATNGGHVPIKKRPQDIGLGWGGYDDFHQWQANGRKINPDDVKDDQWQFDVRKMGVVEKGSGKETKFAVPKGSPLDLFIGVAQTGEGVSTKDLKSLHRVLNPEKKVLKRRRSGGE